MPKHNQCIVKHAIEQKSAHQAIARLAGTTHIGQWAGRWTDREFELKKTSAEACSFTPDEEFQNLSLDETGGSCEHSNPASDKTPRELTLPEPCYERSAISSLELGSLYEETLRKFSGGHTNQG